MVCCVLVSCRYLEGQRNVQTLFLQMLDDLSSSSTNLQEVCRYSDGLLWIVDELAGK